MERSAVVSRLLDRLVAALLAGGLWLALSVPIVTAILASCGLYAVAAEWVEGRQPAVWSTFWSAVRRNARQAAAFGVAATAAVVVVAADLAYGLTSGPLSAAVFVAGVAAALATVAVSVYLVPVMVAFPGPWRTVLRNAALFAAGNLVGTGLAVFVLAAAVACAVIAFPAVPLVAAGTAYVLARLVNRPLRDAAARNVTGLGEESRPQRAADRGGRWP